MLIMKIIIPTPLVSVIFGSLIPILSFQFFCKLFFILVSSVTVDIEENEIFVQFFNALFNKNDIIFKSVTI